MKDAQTDPLIGTIAADKYVILGMISEGGMGAVYRALQLPVEREVALKVLRTELQESDQGKERFIVEARAVGRLNHPNIITLHDYGIDTNNHPYMVMEYAPGQSLARWLRGDIDMDRIVHVMEQVLSALSEAHDRGIVHRDLKPENMIVTKAGTDHDYIKLLDFGIARMINEGATRKLTREGEVFGTPHYMAPEQAQGRRNVGPPADVYACGIIMWELITGQCPFDAPTPLAVLFMHINEDLPKLEPRLGMNVPQEVRDVLAKATKKDSLARYQHAGEMLEALRHSVNKYITRTTLSGSHRARRELAPEPEPEPAPEQPRSSGGDQGRALSLASRASRDSSDSGIVAFDPDPSMERPAPVRAEPAPEPTLAPKPTGVDHNKDGEKAKLRLGLVAVSILALFAVVVTIVVLASDGDAPQAEAAESAIAEGPESEEDSPTDDTAAAAAAESAKNEVATAPLNEKPESEANADQARPEQKLPTETVPVDPSTVAGHSPPGVDKPTAAEETPTPVEKVEPKKVEPKKVEPKKTVAKKTETKKTEPKKTEQETTEDEPKKFEPRTFTEPPPTKWK